VTNEGASRMATTETLMRDEWARVDPNDIRIVELLARGLTDHEVARELGTTHGAVRYSVRRCMLQVGARNRPHLVAKAMNASVIHAR